VTDTNSGTPLCFVKRYPTQDLSKDSSIDNGEDCRREQCYSLDVLSILGGGLLIEAQAKRSDY
jgi:hypothetical protein